MSALGWGLLVLFVVLFIGGLVMLALILLDSGRRVHGVLARRYASGEISTEEFNEHRTVLPGGASRGRLAVAAAVGAIGLVGLILLAIFGPDWSMNGSSMMGDGMGSMMGSGETRRDAPPPVEGDESLEVVAREFSFSRSRLEISAGSSVNVSFRNDGSMFHTFTVEDEDFSLEANAGDAVSGSLKLPPGSYTFICTVQGHAASGMRGTLVVKWDDAGAHV